MRLILVTAVVGFATALQASADLYTGGELSVEWLVDSSDEIIFIQAQEIETTEQSAGVSVERVLKSQTPSAQKRPNADDQPFRLRKDLKGELRLQIKKHDPTRWQNAGWKGGRTSEWLLFIRNDGVERWVVKGINLTYPTETSRTAAITADGNILKQKQKILTHVENRIKQQRKVPDGCVRKFIDNWKSHHTHHLDHAGPKWWFEDLRLRNVRLTNEVVAQVLGGFSVPVAIEYWDDPEAEDVDEDLHVTFVIVPADSDGKERLLKSIASSTSSLAFHQLVALLNYPGEETDAILEKNANSPRGSSHVAHQLLEYLRYARAPGSPWDNRLLGRWRLEGGNETVHLNFKSDHSCSIDVRPTQSTRNNKFYRPVDGKGHWAVHAGKLWISRTHIAEDGRWRKGTRQFFPPKRIVSVHSNEVKLQNGPLMKRDQ